MPLYAVDCVAPALQHTRQQLFSRFRFGQWSRLALIAILAGELHVGSCNFGRFGDLASGGAPRRTTFPHLDPAHIAQFAVLIAAAVFLAIVVFFVFLYIHSVFRFILFESVLRKECSIGEGWQRWHHAGRRYFLWQLVLIISSMALFGMLIGIPIAMMGGAASLKNSHGHLGGMVGSLILLVLTGLFCLLMLVTVQALARDFLVPIMALEDLDFADAWGRLLHLIRIEPWRYVGYLLLKLVMAIVAWIVFSILAFIPALIIIGPAALIVIAGIAAGLTWSVTTVSLAIIFGTFALLLLAYVVAIVATPATVFFPAYAMYFFAGRYPNLQALVYPTPVVPSAPEIPPALETPPEPPPLPPLPEPSVS